MTPDGSDPADDTARIDTPSDHGSAQGAGGKVIAAAGSAWRGYDGALKHRWPRGRWAVHGVTALVVLGIAVSSGRTTGEPVSEVAATASPSAAVVTDPPPTPTVATTVQPTTELTPAPTPEPTPTPTPTPEPTPPPTPAFDFAPIKLTGRGDKVVRFKIPEDAAAMGSFSHSGSGNFAVWTVDDFGDKTDLLVNEIGKYSGRVLFDEDDHSAAFSITASGSWSVNLNPVQKIPKWDGKKARAGKSDDVVWVTAKTGGLATLKLSHKGSGNFAIWAYSESGQDLLVNEIGRYSGEVLLGDAFLLEITANGSWSMSLSE